MAYTMIAERNNQTVRKQRESALIVLANALLLQSEGWQVVIADDNGADLDPRAFEASLARKFSWYEVKPEPVLAAPPSLALEDDEFEPDTFETETLETDALVAAALDDEDQEADDLETDDPDADELESAELPLHQVDEADFDDDADFDEDNLEDADRVTAERQEAELDELEYEGEPAE
jgi:hypothetical protein